MILLSAFPHVAQNDDPTTENSTALCKRKEPVRDRWAFHIQTLQSKMQANFLKEWKHSWGKCPVTTTTALAKKSGGRFSWAGRSPQCCWLMSSSAERRAQVSLPILILTSQLPVGTRSAGSFPGVVLIVQQQQLGTSWVQPKPPAPSIPNEAGWWLLPCAILVPWHSIPMKNLTHGNKPTRKKKSTTIINREHQGWASIIDAPKAYERASNDTLLKNSYL